MESAQESPLVVAQSLRQLLERDTVQVDLIPEKKGRILKHVEYQVTSQRFKISIFRRYSDFDVLHEILLHKFAYRTVPALPPKRKLKGVLNTLPEQEFIEGRRRALRRYINILARHPFFSEDILVQTFLTFSGSEVQKKLREAFKSSGDEFMTNSIATQVKDYLPADVQGHFSLSRELIKIIFNSFCKLRGGVSRMSQHSKETSANLLMFGKELSTIGSDSSPVPSLSEDHCSWASFQQSVKGLSGAFASLADKAAEQVWSLAISSDSDNKPFFLENCGHNLKYDHKLGCSHKQLSMDLWPLNEGKREEDDVVEIFNLFLDVLQSYKDLCERHEKGILRDYQRAVQKYSVLKQRTTGTRAQLKEQLTVAQLESRIVQQENAIHIMELRNHFSLFCLHQETQLVFTYLQIVPHILEALVCAQILGHREMGELWNHLQPKMNHLFGGSNSVSSLPPASH